MAMHLQALKSQVFHFELQGREKYFINIQVFEAKKGFIVVDVEIPEKTIAKAAVKLLHGREMRLRELEFSLCEGS